MRTQLSSFESCSGKTIEKIVRCGSSDPRHVVILFTDDTYIALHIDMGYEHGDEDISVAMNWPIRIVPFDPVSEIAINYSPRFSQVLVPKETAVNDWKLMSESEYSNLMQPYLEHTEKSRRAERRKQWEQLKKEFGE